MKTLMNTLLISTLLVTFLGACTGSKHPMSAQNQEKLGTGDSGGGNLYKDRPIESYAVDITTLPSYKNYIAPIIEALASNKRFSETTYESMSHPTLERIFLSMVKRKTWYFIPGKLETLPKGRTGIVVGTEQGALQSRKEVWFDANLFNKMKEEDQAALFLHEILMGMRILKFSSSQEQCLAFAPAADYCDENSTVLPTESLALTEQDYVDIRAAGVDILKTYSTKTYSDWEDLMARRNFSFGSQDFSIKEDNVKLSPSKFFKILKRTELTRSLPTFGFPGHPQEETWTSSERCQVQLEVLESGKSIKVHLTMGSQKKSFDLVIPENSEHRFTKRATYSQRKLGSLHFSDSKAATAQTGDHYFSVNFYVSDASLAGVEVQEMVYTDVQRGQNGNQMSHESHSVHGGLTYMCWDQPTITFN